MVTLWSFSIICNDMDNTVSICLKVVQQGGKHRRGLPFGVVKQHDSATIGIEAPHHQP